MSGAGALSSPSLALSGAVLALAAAPLRPAHLESHANPLLTIFPALATDSPAYLFVEEKSIYKHHAFSSPGLSKLLLAPQALLFGTRTVPPTSPHIISHQRVRPTCSLSPSAYRIQHYPTLPYPTLPYPDQIFYHPGTLQSCAICWYRPLAP